MTVNLMDLVKGAVGSQIGPLSGILGESEQNTNSAIGTAIPAILGGLMKKGSDQQGAGQIFKTLDDHDGGILDNLGGLLGGGNHQGVMDKGNGLLDMIFGGNRSGLLGTIGRIAGLGGSKTGMLMSLLAPVVMGVLGKQRRSQNLDAGGMMNLLNSQKDHLAGHMPGELSQSLGLGNMFSGAAGAVSGAASAAGQGVKSAAGAVGDAGRATAGAVGGAGRAAAGAAGDAAGAVGNAGKAGGGMLMALLPLLLIGALAFLGWRFFMGGGAGKMAGKAGDMAGEMAGKAGDMAGGVAGGVGDMAGGVAGGLGDAAGAVAGGVGDAAGAVAGGLGDAAGAVAGGVGDVAGTVTGGLGDAAGAVAGGMSLPKFNIPGFDSQKIGGTFGDLTSSISGITDKESATAVASKFEEAGTMLDGLNLGDIAAGPQKEAVGGMFGSLIGKLQPALETAYGIPGVRGVLEPVVTQFMGKLAPLGIGG